MPASLENTHNWLQIHCLSFLFFSPRYTWNRSSWESMMQLIHRPSRGRNGFLCLWAESELKLLPGWALLSVGPALSWESVSWFTPIPPRCLRTKAPNGAPHPPRVFCVHFSPHPLFPHVVPEWIGPGISVSLLLSWCRFVCINMAWGVVCII